MSLDTTLLKLCTKRSVFDRLYPQAPMDGLEESTVTILNAIRAYYKEFPDTTELPISLFRDWATEFRFKQYPDERKSLLRAQIDRLKEGVPPEAEQGMVERLLELEHGAAVLNAVIRWQEGEEFSLTERLGEIQENIALRMDRKVKTPLVMDTPEDLMKEDETNHGFSWRLRCMRESMRSARAGDFGILAMRPDAGKTTLIADITTHWAPQLDEVFPDDRRVGIWLNNEGPGNRIKRRWYQSMLRATIPEMVKWANDGTLSKRLQEAMGEVGLDRMMFFDIHGFSSGEVHQILKRHRPGFVVFDMIDNVRFSGMASNNGQRTDQMLEAMYGQARDWAVQLEFVGMAASQISFEGEGVPFPPQSALKDSKTGKQGACDFIIMGGKLNDPNMDHTRYLGTPKNKLHFPGGKKDPRAEIRFIPERAAFADPED